MIVTVLLSFLAGAVAVIFLELQGLQTLLEPFRNLLHKVGSPRRTRPTSPN
jgi:hypothetical protein